MQNNIKNIQDNITNWLKHRITETDFQEFLGKNLIELCKTNTTPTYDIEKTKKNEETTFNYIKKVINSIGLNGTTITRPLLKKIKEHEFYTPPNYTSLDWPYNKRENLIFIWETDKLTATDNSNRGLALNAHIDTVPPFIEPSKKENYIFGRGTCDDKGGCVTILGTLKLLNEIEKEFNIIPEEKLICMFVIDEEIGGNGSLSCALDETLKNKYDKLIVLEPSDLQIHPGNRGALWYTISLDYKNHSKALILALKIILSLEQEGKKIREESVHPMFDKNYAQTCHGIFGPYGKHPSTICDEIKFSIKTTLDLNQINNSFTIGLKKYIDEYGDKTKEIDETTGEKKVDHHFDFYNSNGTYHLSVWGKSGHMGSILQNDNAITKAAFLLNELFIADKELELDLIGDTLSDKLILEGGQGFTPSHSMEEIKKRFSKAIEITWKETKPITKIEKVPTISFSKLHNDAFAGSAESKVVKDLIKASESIGIEIKKPIKGYPVSCDARIFAKLYPTIDVITMGPGSIKDAHSKDEKINIKDIALNSAALALFIVKNNNTNTKENINTAEAKNKKRNKLHYDVT